MCLKAYDYKTFKQFTDLVNALNDLDFVLKALLLHCSLLLTIKALV